MDLVRTMLSRIAAIFGARRLDASLDEELRAHVDMAVEDHIRRGIPEAEARRLALREFGGMTQTREAYRAQRGLPLLEQVRRDVRFGSSSTLEIARLYADRHPHAGSRRRRQHHRLLHDQRSAPAPAAGSPERPARRPRHESRWSAARIQLSGTHLSRAGAPPRRIQSVFAFDRSPFQVKSGACQRNHLWPIRQRHVL